MLLETHQHIECAFKANLKAVVASTTGSGVVVAKCHLSQVQNVALIFTQSSAFAERRPSPPMSK